MPVYRTKIGDEERLVEANNKATARNFTARNLVEVEIATPQDVARLTKEGKEIEVATGADALQDAVGGD